MKLDRLCTYRQSFVFENISSLDRIISTFQISWEDEFKFLKKRKKKKKKRETKRTKIKPTSPGIKSSSISIPLSPLPPLIIAKETCDH